MVLRGERRHDNYMMLLVIVRLSRSPDEPVKHLIVALHSEIDRALPLVPMNRARSTGVPSSLGV